MRAATPHHTSGFPVRTSAVSDVALLSVSRSGFAPPVAGSRVELIVDGPSVDAGAAIDETTLDEFALDAGAVDPGMDEDPAEGIPADEVDEAELESDPVEAAPVDDDFWTGAASEQSVPTRKVVYGARSTDGGSKHHGWLTSLRRHRR